MRTAEPYFMTNEDWYTFDEKEFKYILTEKAPEEAIKSYEEFYNLLDSINVYDDE